LRHWGGFYSFFGAINNVAGPICCNDLDQSQLQEAGCEFSPAQVIESHFSRIIWDKLLEKSEIYNEVTGQILAVLDGEENITARMATVACLLSQAFPDTYYWTGFYVVDPQNRQELVVGPYQGTLGCLRIAFGRGVCGAAALSGETQVVEDVHALKNHIACDSRSNSEIVVPVHDPAGTLVAVFDVDSTQFSAFDETDKSYLENIISKVFG